MKLRKSAENMRRGDRRCGRALLSILSLRSFSGNFQVLIVLLLCGGTLADLWSSSLLDFLSIYLGFVHPHKDKRKEVENINCLL